jgi:hypothetical protein
MKEEYEHFVKDVFEILLLSKILWFNKDVYKIHVFAEGKER